ncbi:MAG: hypothetical protein AB7G24_06710 [Novosphingobium sp.]
MSRPGSPGLAIIAFIPAMVNPALLPARDGIVVSLCGGPQRASVEIPLGAPLLPGENERLCCGKACHSSAERKRQSGKIDPRQ